MAYGILKLKLKLAMHKRPYFVKVTYPVDLNLQFKVQRKEIIIGDIGTKIFLKYYVQFWCRIPFNYRISILQ